MILINLELKENQTIKLQQSNCDLHLHNLEMTFVHTAQGVITTKPKPGHFKQFVLFILSSTCAETVVYLMIPQAVPDDLISNWFRFL